MGSPKGPYGGRRVLRTIFNEPRSPHSVALRVSADPWALEGPFGDVPRSQMMKFGKFVNIENINRGASGITPEHL